MELNLHLLSANLENDKTQMFSEAIQSLRDIANNLLNKYRDESKNVGSLQFSNNGEQKQWVLLFSLIEKLVSQKRYEYQNNYCRLRFNADLDAKLCWMHIIPNELKRVLSNLLNNAFEACKDDGCIEISLVKQEAFILLTITDNGAGIPSDKIEAVLSGMSLKHPGKRFLLNNANKYI